MMRDNNSVWNKTAFSLNTDTYSVNDRNTVFLDSSKIDTSVSIVGSPTQVNFSPFDSAYSVKFNYGVIEVAESNDFAFFDEDFSIEFWFKTYTHYTTKSILVGINSAQETKNWALLVDDRVHFSVSDEFSTIDISSDVLNTEQWYHIAISRVKGVMRMFVDGAIVSENNTYITLDNSGPLLLGKDFNGLMSNLRIEKAVSAYEAEFTPSTKSLPFTRNTVLLTLNSGSLKLKNKVLTLAKNAKVTSDDVPFIVYSPANRENTSYYFDGFSSVNITPEINLGTKEFEIEFWMNTQNNTDTFSTLVNNKNLTFQFYLNRNTLGTIGLYANGEVVIPDIYVGFEFDLWYNIILSYSQSVLTLQVNGERIFEKEIIFKNEVIISAISGESRGSKFIGYISNFRISNTVPKKELRTYHAPLDVTDDTLLLTCVGGRMMDASKYARSLYGKVTFSSHSPFDYKRINYFNSLDFNGRGSLIEFSNNSVLALGSDDFTIDLWVKFRANNTNGDICQSAILGDKTSTNWFFRYISNNLVFGSLGNNDQIVSLLTVIPINVWVHLAVVRLNGSMYFYIDSKRYVPVNNKAFDGVNLTQNGFIIGATNFPSFMNGNISNMKITKGQALYDSEIIIPLDPRTKTNDILSVGRDTEIVDYSNNKLIPSSVIQVTSSSDNPYWESSNKIIPGSIKLNGSDYLVVAGSVIDVKNEDFTIEFYVYFNDLNKDTTLFRGDNGTKTNEGLIIRSDSDGLYLGINQTARLVNISRELLVENSWFHVAFVRTGSVWLAILDGEIISSHRWMIEIAKPDTYKIGGGPDTKEKSLNGYLSNFRVIKGESLYVQDNKLPTEPLIATDNTLLLLHGNNFGLTQLNNSSQNIVSTAILTPLINGEESALFFNGTNSYFYSPIDLSYDNFKIELKFKFNSIKDNNIITTLNDISLRYSNNLLVLSLGYNEISLSSFLTTDEWYHVQVEKHMNHATLVLNNDRVTGDITHSAKSRIDMLCLGSTRVNNKVSNAMHGYISDIKVTR